MERENELVTDSWGSAMSENKGLLNGLPLVLPESDLKPKPLDEDGTNISLKDWQVGLRNYSMERESMAVAPFRSSKRSVRTRFSPIEPKVDEDTHCQGHSSPQRFETALTTPISPKAGAGSPSASPSRLESSNDGDSSLDKLGIPNSYGQHLHNVNEVCRIASPGITFGEISSKYTESDNRGSRLCQGSSLDVSFPDESESSKGSSTPEIHSRSLLRSRPTHASLDRPESAPVPMRGENPFTFGSTPRERTMSGDKPRGCPLPLPEVEILDQNCGVPSIGDRGSRFRHSILHCRSSLDSIGEGTKYDSSSNLVSGPPATSGRENTSTSNLNAPSFLLRCNARRQHDEVADDDCNEDVKVGMFCGGPFSDTNISGDLVRLLSKLCRLSVPLPKQSVSKASRKRGSEDVRSNSIPPQVFSWETQNSSMPCEDYVVIGRQNSLRLLCDRCSSGSTPSYSVRKPRKIRDHEHHQHFYKPISKTLDQKLRK